MSRRLFQLNDTLRSRWFVLGLHAGLWLLLGLVLVGSGFGRHLPRYQEAPVNAAAVTAPVPVAKLQILFARALAAETANAAAKLDLFTTTYFVPRTPPPAAPVAPSPPPPTTRKVELTYQGFYRTGDGPQYALLRVSDQLVSIPVGGMVVTNLFILEAAIPNLTLTNTAVQTNVLALNRKQLIEVPLK
jgi:hypothetical protein